MRLRKWKSSKKPNEFKLWQDVGDGARGRNKVCHFLRSLEMVL